MAALFAATSGLPFAFPVDNNSMWKYSTFAPSLVTLEDLLEDVLLEDLDGVLLVFFVVDVFFLLLFNEPKSKLMIVIGGDNCFSE